MIHPGPGIEGLEYVQHLSYLGIFLSVGLSGYVIPIPEELILILSGFLAAAGVVNIFVVIGVCIIGAICGDTLIFYLSGHGSRFTQHYHDRVEKTHAGWYMRQMRKHTARTIFISRFIIGFRFLNPLVAGLMRVPFRTFFISTSFSALLYTPIIVLLGYAFSSRIGMVLHIARSVRHDILLLLFIGSALLVLLFFKDLVERYR